MAIRSDQIVWVIEVHAAAPFHGIYYPLAVVTGSKGQAQEMAEEIYRRIFNQVPSWVNDGNALPFPPGMEGRYRGDVAIALWGRSVDTICDIEDIVREYHNSKAPGTEG